MTMRMIFLAILFSISVNFISAQIIYHFPHQNASWGQFRQFNGLNGSTYFLIVNGDTTINGSTYIKVNSMFIMNNDTTLNLYSFIREDSSGKVFEFDGSEKLIYDFNALVGDTLNVYVNLYGMYQSVIVDSISSIQLGNEPRKKISITSVDFTFYGSCFWIEGIGSVAGLFYSAGGQATDWDYLLTCFTENDTLKYSSVSDCNYVTGVTEFQKEQSLNIFPNPTSSEINFTLTSPSSCKMKIEITDALGNIVLQKAVEIKSGANEQKILLPELSSGIYYFRVQQIGNGGNQFIPGVRKMVVMK